MFCPQAIVWGDVATIASAIATFLAVVVALLTSRHAANLAKALRTSERQVELDDEARRRSQLAIAFDQELYMMIGQIDWTKEKLSNATEMRFSSGAMEILRKHMPVKGLVLMDRFAVDFEIFPPEVGARLLNSLGSWVALRDAPPPEISNETDFWNGVQNVIKTLDGMSKSMREARRMLRDFVPANIELPALD